MPASAPQPVYFHLDRLLTGIRSCRACEQHLPLGPRPLVQAASKARVLIVGQAPGVRAHTTGIPWNDASGNRLRSWLDIEPAVFYDPNQVALVPMGFCYPGKGKSGDNPPRRECAPMWMEQLLSMLPEIKLTLLIGQYAQRHLLADARKATLTETVAAWRDYGPHVVPLPHPSPLNHGWLKRNPWFDDEVVPFLREAVRTAQLA